MTIETFRKSKECKQILFDDPIIYQESIVDVETGKPKIDKYLISGLKKKYGELIAVAVLDGKVQFLIYDDLPAATRNEIGMKIISF